MIERPASTRGLLFAAFLFAPVLVCPADLMAQVEAIPQIAVYRVELDGIEPFPCLEVRNIGFDIEKDPNRKPVPFRTRIRNVDLVKQFTKHPKLHQWMHQAKNGQAPLKSGTIYFLDASGKPVFHVSFAKAWLKSWVLLVPKIDEPERIREHLKLSIRDFELIYD